MQAQKNRCHDLAHAMISISENAWANEQAVRRLPTVELQLLAWIRLVDSQHIARCVGLCRGGYRLYVRRSVRNLDGVGEEAVALDIANVCLSPKLQNKGWFGEFLQLVDALNPWDATYVECVNSPHLARYLARCGYRLDGPSSYFQPVRQGRHPIRRSAC